MRLMTLWQSGMSYQKLILMVACILRIRGQRLISFVIALGKENHVPTKMTGPFKGMFSFPMTSMSEKKIWRT